MITVTAKISQFLMIAVLLSVTAVRSQAEEMIELKLKLPAMLFGNAPPKNVDHIPNLPKDWMILRKKPFMVPKGTKLLSLMKKVTHNDTERIVIGEPKMVTDGDKKSNEGTYVEFGPGLKYVQIDLETEYDLSAVVIWHKAQSDIYYDVVVQVCNNSNFKKDVKTLFNNDHDNSSGLGKGKDNCYMTSFQGKIVDAKGSKGRYVRVYSNGSARSEMNHFTEVEIYGRSIRTDKSSKNSASGKKLTDEEAKSKASAFL